MSDPYDPIDLPAQDAREHDAREQAERVRTIEEEDLGWLMGAQAGRRIVWRWLEQCGVFRLSFSSEPLVMAFREGERNHGLRLLADLMRLCPERYADMVNENK